MNYPDVNELTLDTPKVQAWVTLTTLRKRPFHVIALIALDLATTYSFIIAAFLLVAALSSDIRESLTGMVPAWIVNVIPISRQEMFLAAGVAFLGHSISGALQTLVSRHFATSLERMLRAQIIGNERWWFGRRNVFAINGQVARQLLALSTSVRSAVRSARAIINIIPSAILMATTVALLVHLSPTSVWWLASLAIASFVLQKFANRHVVALEKEMLVKNNIFKRKTREMIAQNARVVAPGESVATRDRLNDEYTALSSLYYSRALYIDLTRIISLLVLAILTVAFTLPFLLSVDSVDYSNLLEQLVVLAILGRTAVTTLSGISSNFATLAKYAFHSHIVYLYFRRNKPEGFDNTRVPSRILGPFALDRHTVSYYLDALIGHLKTDVRAQPNFRVDWDTNQILWDGEMAHAIAIVPLIEPGSGKKSVAVKANDLIACHRYAYLVRRDRDVDMATIKRGLNRDRERTRRGYIADLQTADDTMDSGNDEGFNL